ncbi:hypothetical protein [Hymenobacter weizhouensis]|uniref:hypothetical protein n=1 Tax=Hymenobacter sp. YIM 151500-1 TaxID=2987689 RepID=UPI0022264131|nr:hypothetical protein [Hymenobacter sp. YIM 151500-1]UYZ64195.1 hypothetical protein OIS53_04940 [Hymenobacter sp. YIM 151500-1]
MKAAKPAKTFDAVEMMRTIRENITRETEYMSFQELQQYMQQKLKASGFHPTPPSS